MLPEKFHSTFSFKALDIKVQNSLYRNHPTDPGILTRLVYHNSNHLLQQNTISRYTNTEQSKIILNNIVYVMQFHTPSADTYWPTTEVPPMALSANCTSDTIIWSSRTEPQLVQTASPRAGSISISLPPHCVHTALDMMPAPNS